MRLMLRGYTMKNKAFLLLILLTVLSPMVRAEETESLNPSVEQRIEELKRLKAEDPQAFELELEKHRSAIKSQLEKLKAEDPVKYQEVMSRRRQKFRGRMMKLRDENPEHFKEVVHKRREHLEGRAEHLRTSEPEKYNRFSEKRKNQFRRFKQHNPEQFNQFVNNHPHLRERFSDLDDSQKFVHRKANISEENVSDKRKFYRDSTPENNSRRIGKPRFLKRPRRAPSR